VASASVLLRRPRGKWDPFFDVLSPVVWPLVMAVYVGVAEAARVIALDHANRKRDDSLVQNAVDEMETLLANAQLALREMISLANDYDFTPTVARSSSVYSTRRSRRRR